MYFDREGGCAHLIVRNLCCLKSKLQIPSMIFSSNASRSKYFFLILFGTYSLDGWFDAYLVLLDGGKFYFEILRVILIIVIYKDLF